MRRYLAPVAAAVLLVAAATYPVVAAPPGPPASVSTELPADPSGRWIVLLKPGADAAGAAATQGRKIGFSPDHTFRAVIRGYAAKLSGAQVATLRHDPSVRAVVPDERITIQGQVIPTGISRAGATRSAVAGAGDGVGAVDADVAIVDTGVSRVPDLNVVGGYSCANSTTTAWQDGNGHGTHVAGTVGAIDNGIGVVGVAPGVRIWSVKILDTAGSGLLSWYLCGLDWIAAQRDPTDPSRPLIEAVNMSVTKWGSDDGNCGNTNADPLHQAICRVVASGVTVVAAAANDAGSASLRVPAAYNEVITVSALADTDGRPGGLGGNRCYSWGGYDQDDTFADFSNYGSDVDIIAPGKCIWSTIPDGYAYMSGTSMAAPHVTGAVALLKQDRPYLTPSEVREALRYLGTSDWKWWTDPDSVHEPLLDVSRIGPRGDFSFGAEITGWVGPDGGAAVVPVVVHRSSTSFERVQLSATDLPDGATVDSTSTYGFGDTTARLAIHLAGPIRAPVSITIVGDEHGNRHTTTATIAIDNDPPAATAPTASLRAGGTLGTSTTPVLVSWHPGTDAASGVAGYEVQRQVDGGAWTTAGATTGTTLATSETVGRAYRYRTRARDAVGTWSSWVAAASAGTSSVLQESSSAISWTGRWTRDANSAASGGATRYSTSFAAHANLTFTGRSIAIVAPRGPTRGRASVYIDGVYKAVVDLSRSSGLSREVVYVATFSSVGTHRIEFRVAGSKRVDLDGFVIRR
jgi:subtilisin